MAEGIKRVFTYKPSPTGDKFHKCFSSIKGIMGCVGSGKSVICVEDMFFKSNTMPANPYDGVRRSKWLIIRQTFQMLRTTTIPTLLAWFPQIKMRWTNPLSGKLIMPSLYNDGTTLDMQFEFLGMDNDNAIEKLKSYEVSGVWVNEAGEVPWKYIAMAFQRTGRYPKSDADVGVRYRSLGLIMDTNPPSDTSWWYDFAEIKKPKGMTFFRQPPALIKDVNKDGKIFYVPNRGQVEGIPKAENVENHNEGFDYWMKQTYDEDHNRIKVFVLGEYGVDIAGTPVYPEYKDNLHYANGVIDQIPGLPLYLGTDFGRTPATVICQLTPFGQLRVLDEVCTNDFGITQYTKEVLIPKLMNEYHMYNTRVYNFADPAGNDKGQIDDATCIQVMRSCGLNTVASPVLKNGFVLRRESVAKRLNSTCDGKPGIIISSKCHMLRTGFLGRYYYKTASVADSGEEVEVTQPQKNIFSHIQDALQYVSCGLESDSRDSIFSGYEGAHEEFARKMGFAGTNNRGRIISTKMDMNGFF